MQMNENSYHVTARIFPLYWEKGQCVLIQSTTFGDGEVDESIPIVFNDIPKALNYLKSNLVQGNFYSADISITTVPSEIKFENTIEENTIEP